MRNIAELIAMNGNDAQCSRAPQTVERRNMPIIKTIYFHKTPSNDYSNPPIHDVIGKSKFQTVVLKIGRALTNCRWPDLDYLDGPWFVTDMVLSASENLLKTASKP